ncbi:MAG: hypothetical protein ACRDMZ_23860, partial [Solirubrobacteraceae bacterium]
MHGSHARSRLTFLLVIAAALALGAGPALALPEDPDRPAGGGGPTRLEQAREESGVQERPANRLALPVGVLRLSRSELLATGHMDLELSVTLDRDVGA